MPTVNENKLSHTEKSPPVEGMLGVFASADALAAAVQQAQKAHCGELETYMPVGDAHSASALVSGESPVRWFGLAGGMAGLSGGLGLIIWMSQDYPLITGGKPIVSLPPFLVIAFEIMVLLAALGTLFGFLLFARLPHLTPSSAYRREFAIDTFALFIRAPQRHADLERAARVLWEAGALDVQTVWQEDRGMLGEVP